MGIEFFPITAAASSFPRPFLPVQPVLGYPDRKGIAGQASVSSAFIGAGTFLGNARTCLAHALRLSGAGPQSAILMPAYHCASMVEPAVWLGAEILFYPMKADLSPSAADIEELLRQASKPVKAMVLPHYFGFPQETGIWRKLCDEHRMMLIEDCAHAFFGSNGQGQALGSVGDYAVASVRKFFPSPNGGILVGRNVPAKLGETLSKPGLKQELKAALLAGLESASAGKLGVPGKLLLALDTWRMRNKVRSAAAESVPALAPQWHWFDPDEMNLSGLAVSGWLMRHCAPRRNAANRRRNYLRLLGGVRHIGTVRPLFAQLPDTVVPYMFPLLLLTGERDFERLKLAGIPIWRWEDLAVSACPVSRNYRLALLQIPCHQSLTTAEVDRIIHQLEYVLGGNSQ